MKFSIKAIGLILFVLLFGNVNAEIVFSYFDQYANLYPDCEDTEKSKIYTLDEPYIEEPVFPGGGRVQMTRFVWFSTEVLDVKGPDGLQLKGKVLVRTVVDRCGVVGDLEVIQSLSDQQDAEALRVVESFPIMKPATLDGYRVKVEMVVPVYFTKTYVPKKHYYYDDEDEDYYESDDYSDDSSDDSGDYDYSDDDWGDDWGDDW